MPQGRLPDPNDETTGDELTEEGRTTLIDRFVQLGCTRDDAELLAFAGVEPDVVGDQAPGAVGFVRAAVFHGLPDINERLDLAGGDAEWAWEMWAEESGER